MAYYTFHNVERSNVLEKQKKTKNHLTPAEGNGWTLRRRFRVIYFPEIAPIMAGEKNIITIKMH